MKEKKRGSESDRIATLSKAKRERRLIMKRLMSLLCVMGPSIFLITLSSSSLAFPFSQSLLSAQTMYCPWSFFLFTANTERWASGVLTANRRKASWERRIGSVSFPRSSRMPQPKWFAGASIDRRGQYRRARLSRSLFWE